jgi:hypothetical protein
MSLMIISIVASLLPQRYRARLISDHDVNVRRGAMLSGMLQMLGCLAVAIVRYIFFLQQRAGDMATVVIKKGAEEALASNGVQFGTGILALMEYMIQPLTLVLLYFTIEGLFRWLAALITDEVLPSLLLQLLAWVQEWHIERRAAARLGPLIADVVLADPAPGIALRIESCRPREWTELTTISYQEKLYEVAHMEEGAAPRRFIYELRPAPVSRLVRGLHHYSPDELLPKKAGDAEAATAASAKS